MDIQLIDKYQDFLQDAAANSKKMYTIYFGLKAAPLTLAHECIIDYLVNNYVKIYQNIRLHIGIANSEFRKKFKIFEMVQDFVCSHYPGMEIAKSYWYSDRLQVVEQDGWQGLYNWLKSNHYDGECTLVVIGEDEAEHIRKDDGVWKDIGAFTREYRFHIAKMRDDEISATKAREIFFSRSGC